MSKSILQGWQGFGYNGKNQGKIHGLNHTVKTLLSKTVLNYPKLYFVVKLYLLNNTKLKKLAKRLQYKNINLVLTI